MAIGEITVFFNELSFPLITLGMPLLLYILLTKDKWKKVLFNELQYSIAWGVGYFGVWFGKWAMASLFTGTNYLSDAFNQATQYVTKESAELVEPTVFERLFKNMFVLVKWPFVILFTGVLLYCVICLVKRIRNTKKISLAGTIPFLYIIIITIMWYVVLGNGYAYVHYWFAYRNLSIICMTGIAGLVAIIEESA